ASAGIPAPERTQRAACLSISIGAPERTRHRRRTVGSTTLAGRRRSRTGRSVPADLRHQHVANGRRRSPVTRGARDPAYWRGTLLFRSRGANPETPEGDYRLEYVSA